MVNVSSREFDGGSNLFSTVVDGGYCVGCGACASVEGSPVTIELDEYNKLQAKLNGGVIDEKTDEILQRVCPFSNLSVNEDEIGKELFSEAAGYHDKIGYNMATYAGHVIEDGFRERGSSGGMGSWIASELFNKGYVNKIIHIHQRVPSEDDPRLFHYQISSSIEEIRQGSKSRYYPIELSEMMKLIKSTPANYLIVGVPCFIKSVRLLTRIDRVLKERIKFCVGLVCGHLKSSGFAEMLAWQSGVAPKHLQAFDFRTKLSHTGANHYGTTAVGLINNEELTKVSLPVNKLYGTDWGLGFFKYKACDYCDDVVAETADVTIGDAWLPQYVKDSQGTNIIIVRNPIIKMLLTEASDLNRVELANVSEDDVVRSQNSGFEHRRAGLAYRLHLTDETHVWRPEKRVKPNFSHLSEKIKMRQKLRVILARESHIAFKAAREQESFIVFKKQMDPIVRQYRKLYQPNIWMRVVRKLKSIFFDK